MDCYLKARPSDLINHQKKNETQNNKIMDEHNCTTITITPPKGSNLKPATILVNHKLIEAERLDIIKKACQRLWQSFITENNWETQ